MGGSSKIEAEGSGVSKKFDGDYRVLAVVLGAARSWSMIGVTMFG